MIKEIKYGGYTESTSDYDSPDGEIALSVNLVHKNGDLHAMHIPTNVCSLQKGEELIFIHTVNDNTKFLIIKKDKSLYYGKLGEASRTIIKTYDVDTIKCTATGNVLCVYGAGSLDHFVYLRGEYRPFSTSDYAVTLQFGLDSLIRTQSQVINSVLKDSNGSSVATWENVVSHDYDGVSSGTAVACNLLKGVIYRIKIAKKIATSTMYFTITLYDANGEWYELEAGIVGSDFEFTPTMNVVRIYVGFRSGSQDGPLWNSKHSGTISVDKQVEVIQPSGKYLYNANENTNNALLGLANTLLANCLDDNRFALPFFVRYGFRMITGDIITVSPPILMEPNTEVTPVIELGELEKVNSESIYYKALVTAKAYSSKLMYRVKDKVKLQNLLDMEDLVDTLVIAVSEPIYLYKEGASLEECSQNIYVTDSAPANKTYSLNGIKNIASTATSYLTLPHFDSYEEKVSGVSAFKIVKEIKKDEISMNDNFVDVPLDADVLKGLSGNTSLLPDNTENLATYNAKYAMSYNQREHWVGVIESEFVGFDLDAMCGFVQTQEHDANYKVGIEQRESEALQYAVRGKNTQASANRRWFFYTNSKAVEATIYENGKQYKYKLQAHTFLKGAYRLGDPLATGDDTDNGLSLPRSVISTNKDNMVFVSVQGNPIMIEQRVRVGDGILYAAASNTRPITRNQFGQSPLYIFSSDGIWAMEVATDGRYSVRQPVSRDVCNNVKSITPIDSAVLFTTKRGIMMLSGTDTQCISEPINTNRPFNILSLGNMLKTYLEDNDYNTFDIMPFNEFISNCQIIYDYVGQLLIVFRENCQYAYAYSIGDKKWSFVSSKLLYTVNAYPEAWAVEKEGDSLNIVNFSDVVIDNNPVKGLLVSRPIKLDAPDILKTVDTVIQRGMFRRGHVKSILFGSRDLFNWQYVYSSTDHYLRGFRGSPYKYFRIVLICDILPDESLFGATIQYTPRLLNQPR